MIKPLPDPPVLVVEDCLSMGSLICRLVGDLGYRSTLAMTGEDAVAIATTREPTALIVDVYLPGIDGLAVVRCLRKHGLRSPILIVTVAATTANELDGFDAGADDYLRKPFDTEVFKARLSTAVRRFNVRGASNGLHFHGLVVDPIARFAVGDGRRLPLSPLEFSILHVLIGTPETPVSLLELAHRAWGDREMRDGNAYRVALARLRRKLELHSCGVLIRTVRNEGYLLAADRGPVALEDQADDKVASVTRM